MWKYLVEKTRRHETALEYFNNRGYLYQKGVGAEIIKDWVQQYEKIAVDVDTGSIEWPEDLFP